MSIGRGSGAIRNIVVLMSAMALCKCGRTALMNASLNPGAVTRWRRCSQHLRSRKSGAEACGAAFEVNIDENKSTQSPVRAKSAMTVDSVSVTAGALERNAAGD